MPERKTLNEDLFCRGSSANLPRLHTCENKVPFWDFSQFAVTVGCCFQDLFNTTRSILVQFVSSFFSRRLVSVHVMCPSNSNDTTAAWKNSRFISSDRSNFYMIDNQSIAVYAFAWRILTSLSVDETLLPRYVKFSTNFRGPPFRVEMAPSRIKFMYSLLFEFTWRPMSPATYSRLCCWDSAWEGVFTRSAMSSA